MSWIFVIALALLIFVLLAVVLKAPRGSWEVLGAALLLGLAGYAWQGAPALRGAPKAPAESTGQGEAALDVAERQKLAQAAPMSDKDIVVADALARHGQFADSAEFLRGAVQRNPDNADAWLAMANSLVGHAEGTISPAAIYAYDQAERAAPGSPGPGFFKGLAMIRSGRLEDGRKAWAALLAQTPPDAPWRADLAQRLAELDQFLARAQEAQ
ncbi:tetratricopeptide repeat protein [Novosphingobium piscinae]|uniref:Tetratricopeptide repeat protein n=1 Tax=Novosphingobium piscinae TaxID=1507448 RepID=A0A7X1FY85_9SPHN|nr:tetratricopeptide repeat protein [Novosphingobium piscinae]MBC2668572.1 tetratricopeptide repeat protein [Novosphingobium piscinae]